MSRAGGQSAHSLNDVMRLVLRSWTSRIYLAAVLATAIFTIVSLAREPGPNFVGIYVIFLTLPWSLAGLLLTAGLGMTAFWVVVAVSALFNAFLLAQTGRSQRAAKRPR